ncbi:hypothetical protein RQP54_18215 [Curvibacter sp. APW13]|uniref:hypothetical protein n=1 Tax=Curvibacter sp. APW13 TaxID=3077236 RepID=UPI0028DF3F65|nr:hypothetical protein [Curvibacter sp. APW13]MDT8992814.1 hypothetical protein [Curvibacter sp. APW13]
MSLQNIEVIRPGHPLYQTHDVSPNTMDVINAALQKDCVARRIQAKGISPRSGDPVGVRLNINVLKHTGVAVHSIHKATSPDGHTRGRGLYNKEVISYLNVVQLHDAYFNVHQKEREKIALGGAKAPMASVDGRFSRIDGEPEFGGLEVSFNPHTVHLFVDSRGYAVRYAEEVTILGHRVYARGKVEFYTPDTAPARAGTAHSLARLVGEP